MPPMRWFCHQSLVSPPSSVLLLHQAASLSHATPVPAPACTLSLPEAYLHQPLPIVAVLTALTCL